MSSGSGALLAVAYERGGLEFFDMEGERIGEPALFRLKSIADGRYTTVDNSSLTLFPGVTEAGELKGYIYTPGLMAPTQIDLPIPEDRSVQGLCSGEAGTQGLIRIAYCAESGQWRPHLGARSRHRDGFPHKILRFRL